MSLIAKVTDNRYYADYCYVAPIEQRRLVLTETFLYSLSHVNRLTVDATSFIEHIGRYRHRVSDLSKVDSAEQGAEYKYRKSHKTRQGHTWYQSGNEPMMPKKRRNVETRGGQIFSRGIRQYDFLCLRQASSCKVILKLKPESNQGHKQST